MAPSDFTTTSLGRFSRWPLKLFATTVILPSGLLASHAAAVVLASQEASLQVPGETVGPVGRLLEQCHAVALGPLHPTVVVDVTEEEVSPFLPPQRSLRRALPAALAVSQFFDTLAG